MLGLEVAVGVHGCIEHTGKLIDQLVRTHKLQTPWTNHLHTHIVPGL